MSVFIIICCGFLFCVGMQYQRGGGVPGEDHLLNPDTPSKGHHTFKLILYILLKSRLIGCKADSVP